MPSRTFDLLQKATANLLYPSETDAPFELSESSAPFVPPTDTLIEESSLADIFDPGDPNFQNLRALLEKSLTDIRVLRAGKVEITLYITGKSPANTTITLKTLSVETG